MVTKVDVTTACSISAEDMANIQKLRDLVKDEVCSGSLWSESVFFDRFPNYCTLMLLLHKIQYRILPLID